MSRFLILMSICCWIVACKSDRILNDFAVVHGTITNPIDSLDMRLYDPINNKNIYVKINEDGSFRDTIEADESVLFTVIYHNIFNIYLQNDMDINLTLDSENFSKSLTFKGRGIEENNFLKFKAKQQHILYGQDYKVLFNLEESAFNSKTDEYISQITQHIEATKSTLDTAFMSNQITSFEQFKVQHQMQYDEQQKVTKSLDPGMTSPSFTDYVNYKGGTASLKDYKGSYVYIDIWATWCGPCKHEIPFMEKIEEEYHDKNITFISLSIDNKKDEQKWRKMIGKKNMKGIQLLADAAYDSQFVMDYHIVAIPRFILIDPDGNIINYDAPRPSDAKLKEILDNLDA